MIEVAEEICDQTDFSVAKIYIRCDRLEFPRKINIVIGKQKCCLTLKITTRMEIPRDPIMLEHMIRSMEEEERPLQ